MFLHLETGLFFLRSNTFSGGKGYLQFLHKVQRSNSYLCGLCNLYLRTSIRNDTFYSDDTPAGEKCKVCT